MINKGTKQKLTQYLRATAPNYAILLRGSWGAGKSYFWNRFKEQHLGKLNKKDITFSVAGLATLEELEDALFLASVKNLGTDTLRETGTVIGKALIRLVKVDPDDIKLKANVRPGKTVVCIDDMERFGGDFKVLFGFVVSLLDAAKLHVVLISDEERAAEDLIGYVNYKEKIISVTAEIRADIDAFYADTVKGFSHQKTREALLAIREHAVTFFSEKGLKNLRTLRSIVEEMNQIMSEMTWPEGVDASLGDLLSAVSFHVMAVTKDVSNESLVKKIFVQGDIGMAVTMNRIDRKNAQPNASRDDSFASIGNLVDSLKFESDIYGWHGSQAFADYVAADGFEPDRIAQDFQVFGYTGKKDQSVLERLRSYRSMSELEFRSCLANLEEKVIASDFEALQEIWEAYQILDHFSQQRLIPDHRKSWRKKFVELAANFDVTRNVVSSLEFWPEQYDEDQTAVRDALKALGHRFEAVRTKLDNETMRKTLIEGAGSQAIEAFATPFSDAIASEIYDRLKAAGREGVIRVSSFFRKRIAITNIKDFAAVEVPFAVALAKTIRSNTLGTAPISLDEAEWLELAGNLERFVAKIAPPPNTAPSRTDLPPGNRTE